MQEKESIIVVWCELKILSLRSLIKVLIIKYARIFISYSEHTSLRCSSQVLF